MLSKWIFTDPDVLILDEPTRGIDVGAKYEIYTIINRLADEGKAVLVISSELPELLGICDRIYALSAGRITGEVARARRHPGAAHAVHDPGDRSSSQPMTQRRTDQRRPRADEPPARTGDAGAGAVAAASRSTCGRAASTSRSR